jgi:hypothetical protein
MTRLAGSGLVENVAEHKEKAAAKAWHLTELGAQLARATRAP